MKAYRTSENKGSKLVLLLLMCLVLAFSMCMVGCGDDEVTDDDIDYAMNEGGSDDPDSGESVKGAAKAKVLNQDVSNFYGTWEATSGEAVNLYGNLKITINEDGTFDANVTDEEMSGTWTKSDTGINYKCDYMRGSIYYGDHGKLVIEDNENGDVKVVLNKVN